MIDSNTIQDTNSGGMIGVSHSSYTKADGNRVYYTGAFTNNTALWTAAYVAARAASGNTAPNLFLTVGDPTGIDAGEVNLTTAGNVVSGPLSVVTHPTLLINDGTINGVAEQSLQLLLPTSATAAATPPRIASGTAAPISSLPITRRVRFASLSPISAPDTIAVGNATQLRASFASSCAPVASPALAARSAAHPMARSFSSSLASTRAAHDHHRPARRIAFGTLKIEMNSEGGFNAR